MQYNLVPANGRWCLAAGKVTVGLALHWPCVTDNSGFTTYGLNGLRKGDEHPAWTPVRVWHTLPLRLPSWPRWRSLREFTRFIWWKLILIYRPTDGRRLSWQYLLATTNYYFWLAYECPGGRVVMEPDLRSTGRGFESRPPRCRVQPWASCLHTCASVIKRYNLVPATRRWCSAAWEVTAGLTESNGSRYRPVFWLRSPAGWLTRTGISSGTLRSFRVRDY